MSSEKVHRLARHVSHLREMTSRAADTFEQIRRVLVRTNTPPLHVKVAMLETIGKLHTETAAWRRRLAADAVRDGISQRVVAEAVGVSRRTVQVWSEEPGPVVRPVRSNCDAIEDAA